MNNQDTYIDQTFSDLDGLTTEQLQDEQMKTLVLKNSIDCQILNAKLLFQKDKIKADPAWLTDATFKSKLCGFRLERIKHMQGRLREAKHKALEEDRSKNFSVQFIAIAKDYLPSEIFDRIVEETNNVVSNV